jgi:hypothetical protein
MKAYKWISDFVMGIVEANTVEQLLAIIVTMCILIVEIVVIIKM